MASLKSPMPTGAHPSRDAAPLSQGAPLSDKTKKQVIAAPGFNDPAQMPEPGSTPRSRTSRLADAAAFLRGFLAHPFEVASVMPSSAYLESRVVKAADLGEARCVVELGPGTGGTTRALLRMLAPRARLLAIEVNPDFCDRLRRLIDDPRLVVQAGSAESLAEALHARGLPAADVVVSGIPFSVLPSDVAQHIAAAIFTNLAPGGRLVAYQCSAHVARCLTPYLGPPRTLWEWRSLPPMRVFVWRKPVADTSQ